MKPEKRELVRRSILLIAESSKPYAIALGLIEVGLQMRGIRGVEAEDLRAEIDYLADKNFLSVAERALSPENQQWKITAAGRDFLATEGLA